MSSRSMFRFWLSLLLAGCGCAATVGQENPSVPQDKVPAAKSDTTEADEGDLSVEQVFSGPQASETLPELSALPLLGDSVDPIEIIPSASHRPQLIIFMHQRTRPSFGLLRGLTAYSKHLGDKLDASVIFLTDDVSETKQWSVNARRSIPEGAKMLVSDAGLEGPGAWGLNRNVTMTVVLGQDGKAVENFALIQPSAADDLKKISAAIATRLKVDPPNQRQLSNWLGQRAMQKGNQPAVDIRPLLAPVIQKTATPEMVEAAAEKVIARADKDLEFKVAVGDACRRIVGGGVLRNYGTEKAQAYLQTWSETFKREENSNEGNDSDRSGKQ